MIQKLKIGLLSLSTLVLLSFGLVAPATVSAANIQGNLCSGADTLTTNTVDTGCAISGVNSCDFNCVLSKVINIFSVIVGVIAVIMIIVGGFRYITSGGKQESVSGAKNTILYAIIGLVIVAFAQVIVRFVLTKATTA